MYAKELEFAWIFSDHAVLQQEMFVPVWGKAQPGAQVTVTLNGQKISTTASRTGDFMLRLAPMPAGGPYVLTATSGDDKLEVQDVMIGEVWIAGGQSNMQYQLNSTWSPKWSSMSAEEQQNCMNRVQMREYLSTITDANLIRAIHVPRKTSLTMEKRSDAQWTIMDAEHAGDLSAVGAWFGRFLKERTGVAVGILSCNWGGTFAEAWTSRGGLQSNPVSAPLIAAKDKAYSGPAVDPKKLHEEQRAAFIKANHLEDPGNKGFGNGWAKSDFDDSAWKDMNIPGDWMSQKLMGNGILWVRTHAQIPKEWLGKDLILHLGPIDKQDISYFNGTEVGRSGKGFEEEYWDVPRTYNVPGKLVTSEFVTIAVRAYSFYYNGSLHGAPELFNLTLAGTDKTVPLAGVWKANPELDFGKTFYFYEVNPYGAGNPNTPSILFDSMLNALIPYGIRGAIWYQGESNANMIQQSKEYRSVLGTMIRDWRYHWGQGDFPFLQVQLAAFRTPSSFNENDAWPFLRESQLQVCQDLPNVYLASAIDVGDPADIHPMDKKTVGSRLFHSAMNHVYGANDEVPFGPLYQSFSAEGSALRLSFKYGQGMHFKDGAAKGFYIAGEDRKFLPADKVVIDGDSILVSNAAIAHPAAVRYAWSNCPDGNLYNAAELPASSFRTDEW